MTILLWGLIRDHPIAAVLDRLRHLGAPVRFLEADVPDAPAGRRGGGQPITVPYRTGTMLFTESELWHRISDSRCLTPGQRRVTYQGHGVRLDDRWILFW